MKGTVQLSSLQPAHSNRGSSQRGGGISVASALSQRPTPTMPHTLSAAALGIDPRVPMGADPLATTQRKVAPSRSSSVPLRSPVASCVTPSVSRATSMARQPVLEEVDMKVRLGQLLGQPLMARYYSDLLDMVRLEGEMMEKTK